MIDRFVSVFRALIFILIALALCGVIFQAAGYSAPLMFRSIADGAFLRPGALQQALRWGLPLFITAVGVAVSFRAGYFNIGAQGQFYMGAIAAAFIAGRTAPEGKRMGHPGAIIPGGSGTAESKVSALEAAGFRVAGSPTEIPQLLRDAGYRP